jgi:hypothetical protein
VSGFHERTEMTNDQSIIQRLIECSNNPTPEFIAIKQQWQGFKHTVRIDGKLRLEGYITFLLSNYELLRCVDPTLPLLPRPHLFEPETIAWMWGIPIEELGCRKASGKIGKPGRPKTTRDLAEFANERRPNTTWKDIFSEWKRLHPDNSRGITQEKIEEAHRRHFRDKGRNV